MSEASTRAPHLGERQVYTVSELNRSVRRLLEQDFGPLWIQGEVSNLSRPASGHLYFTLKDRQAQVRCALFRNRRPAGGWLPKDGEQVLLWARVSLYEPRGDYQLIAEQIEPLGDGLLRQKLEALKLALHEAGLFDAARKRALPRLPRRIGIITSDSGAALRDVLQVLRRRAPFIPLVIYPTPVQGEQAPAAIRRALATAVRRAECDLLLLVRGGGSLEDLWAFNDEGLARDLYDCPLPVVTGIGHEIDLTIADLVADVRAPTPSAAAELVSPDRAELAARVGALAQRLQRAEGHLLRALRASCSNAERRLQAQHPLRRLQQQAQACDELSLRLQRALRQANQRRTGRLEQALVRLGAASPRRPIANAGLQLSGTRGRLLRAGARLGEDRRARLAALGRALEAVSPLGTLARGYAVITREGDAAALRDAAAVQRGERIHARLARGALRCRVESAEPDSPD